MAPVQKPTKLGMNTDELKAFTELNTTLRLSIQGLNAAIENMSSEIKSLRKETNDRFDRIEGRWDERLRILESKTAEYDVEVNTNKEEIGKLREKGNIFDLALGIMSAIGTFFGIIYGSK